MLEIFAYQIVVLQMSIYISQNDVIGGLHWDHNLKGDIFLFWALAQRLTPMFFGSFADKKGYKLTMLASYMFIIAGYWFLGTQTDYLPFLFGAIILGFGSGMFKPAAQGAIAHQLNDNNSSRAWGIYFMLLNLAVLIAIPFSKYLKSTGWVYIFLGAALVILVNFFLTLFLYDDSPKSAVEESTFRHSINNLRKPRVFLFIIIMSGFTTTYMQFYETLPNFIYDWVDTSDIISLFNLSNNFTMLTSLGKMVSYEWLYSINTILVILFVTYFSKVFSKSSSTHAIWIGIALSVAGLFICGFSNVGLIFLLGIVIYTFGEMITNPQFVNFLSKMSGEDNKATLIGFVNLSFAIGLGSGAKLGGYLYNTYGDKSNLASQYLLNHYHIQIDSKFAIEKLKSITGLNDIGIRDFLWNYYQPNRFWFVFLCIGLLTLITLFWYKKAYNSK
jgi:proton-dependent oligopeptide transporter, POT family